MNKENPSQCEYLDLRGTPCPVNYIRSSLAAEKLTNNDFLNIDLDKGEPEEMVFLGLKKAGHNVKVIINEVTWVRLMVTSSG